MTAKRVRVELTERQARVLAHAVAVLINHGDVWRDNFRGADSRALAQARHVVADAACQPSARHCVEFTDAERDAVMSALGEVFAGGWQDNFRGQSGRALQRARAKLDATY